MTQSAEVETRSGLSGFLADGLKPTALFLAIYFLASIVMRLALPNALTLDEAEQSLFSQHWLLGYGPQPPFYNWVQNAFVAVMGISLLSLALPKFLMLFLCYVFYGLAAREMAERPIAVSLAMLSLLALPQLSYMPQQDLTHTVAVLMAAALFLYCLARTFARPDWQGYAILGLAIGIGTISKYNFVLLPAATLAAVLCDARGRVRLFDGRVLLTALIAGAIVLPHVVWLASHLDLATHGTITKMVDQKSAHGMMRVLRALLSLVLACLAFGGLAVLVLTLPQRAVLRAAWQAQDDWTRLLGRIMLFCLLGVVLVILVTGTTKITERWLDPYLLPLPLFLLLKLQYAGADSPRLLRRLLPLFLIIMAVALLPAAAKTWGAGLTGSYGRMNMPFDLAAQRLRADRQPGLILAQGMHLAGNMRLQFPHVPVIDLNDLAEGEALPIIPSGPILVVWVPAEAGAPQDGPDVEATAGETQRKITSAGALELPYRFSRGGPLWKLAYAWLE